MNHKKVKKQINKINSFFESITADDEVSKIEKDLLLSYVRKLYETISDHENPGSSKATKEAKKAIPVKEALKKAPIKESRPDPVPETVVERKPFEREIPKVTVSVQIPTPAEQIIDSPIVEKTPTPQPIIETTTEPMAAQIADDISDNMLTIFEKSSGNELSDKLGNLPIKDLTRALGINDRILTTKELFGGSQDKLNTTLSDLNGMSNFEEAKAYLINGIAKEQEWDDAAKYKKAVVFVKLVQRRYS